MKFVTIRDTTGGLLVVNVGQIAHILQEANSGSIVNTMETDRRIRTNQFRNVTDAVHFCTTTEFDTSTVGELK